MAQDDAGGEEIQSQLERDAQLEQSSYAHAARIIADYFSCDEEVALRAIKATWRYGGHQQKTQSGMLATYHSPVYGEAWQGGGITQVALTLIEGAYSGDQASLQIYREADYWGNNHSQYNFNYDRWKKDQLVPGDPVQVFHAVSSIFNWLSEHGVPVNGMHELGSGEYLEAVQEDGFGFIGLAHCGYLCKVETDYSVHSVDGYERCLVTAKCIACQKQERILYKGKEDQNHIPTFNGEIQDG